VKFEIHVTSILFREPVQFILDKIPSTPMYRTFDLLCQDSLRGLEAGNIWIALVVKDVQINKGSKTRKLSVVVLDTFEFKNTFETS
jgi:hypothetical protein